MSNHCHTELTETKKTLRYEKILYKVSGMIVTIIGIASLFTLRKHFVNNELEVVWLNGSISLFLILFGVFLLYKGITKKARLMVNACCSRKTIEKLTSK